MFATITLVTIIIVNISIIVSVANHEVHKNDKQFENYVIVLENDNDVNKLISVFDNRTCQLFSWHNLKKKIIAAGGNEYDIIDIKNMLIEDGVIK